MIIGETVTNGKQSLIKYIHDHIFIFYQEFNLDGFVWENYERVLHQQAIMFTIFTAVIGTMFGSFLNVIITRLPEKGKFLSESRSYCLSCGTTLKWYDLLPVVSWFILLGKCRTCKARISFRYPLVELMGALLAASAVWRFGFNLFSVIVYAVVSQNKIIMSTLGSSMFTAYLYSLGLLLGSVSCVRKNIVPRLLKVYILTIKCAYFVYVKTFYVFNLLQ